VVTSLTEQIDLNLTISYDLGLDCTSIMNQQHLAFEKSEWESIY
jgi:hypothetical protein